MIELQYKMNIIKKEDETFPQNLKVLSNCPDIIYVLGNTKILNDFSISVVGSRVCDDYGIEVTKRIVKELVKRNICIVSGLANGIDTIAHYTAIENGGKTIAIIGCGFGNIYPSNNNKLLKEIIEHGGAIISEYLPDQMPLKQCFPHRNRLVACFSESIIVTEAREKSGAIITASIAKQYKKNVYIVPGEITNSKCRGSNYLIRDGAKVILNVNDSLENFPQENILIDNKKTDLIIDDKYKDTYELIEDKPKNINEICKLSAFSAQKVMTDLTLMEMDGIIKSLPGGYYKRSN